MTITIAWLRRRKQTTELVIASDSRLRSYGHMDQAQKLFILARGDCCLAFCGDAQVAYPLFIQVATALDNFGKTRTRASDTIDIRPNIRDILNNLIDSWDASLDEKRQQLADTKMLFGGWSWRLKRFDVGFFQFKIDSFSFHHLKARALHPWYERDKSLVFIGEYADAFMSALRAVIEKIYGKPADHNQRNLIEFNYEPVQALHNLLERHEIDHTTIGGAPQLVKIYPYGSPLPFVIRTRAGHFLLGRRLFDWEKTEYPVLNLVHSPARVLYPKQYIPTPAELEETPEQTNQIEDDDLGAS